MRHFFLTLLCVVLLSGSAAAAGEETERDLFGLDNLDRSAQEYLNGANVTTGNTLEENLAALFDGIQIESAVKQAVKSGVLILVVVLLCSIGQTDETLGIPAVQIAGTLAVAAIAVTDIHSMLGLGLETIRSITTFSNVIMPTITVISASTGAITGAAARYGITMLYSGLVTNLIEKFLVPAVYGYIAMNLGYSAIGNPGLKRIAAFLKWVVVTVLTITLLSFTAYLSISGIMTGSADVAAIKAAKFTISGAVPVVGGILADASESILASAGILKGTVGVFGMIVVIGICLIPFLRLAGHYLVYKLVSALAATVGNGQICELIDSLGTTLGLILGMTGACGLLLLVSLVSCARMITV